MMDRKQQHQVTRVGNTIPYRLQRALVREEIDDEQMGNAMDILDNKNTSDETKEGINDLIKSEAFVQRRKVVNKRVEREIDRHITKRIQHEIRSGRLKPAKHDKFTRMIQRKTAPRV